MYIMPPQQIYFAIQTSFADGSLSSAGAVPTMRHGWEIEKNSVSSSFLVCSQKGLCKTHFDSIIYP